MAWVPILDSDYASDVTVTGATIGPGSVVTAVDEPSSSSIALNISGVASDLGIQLRATVQSYSAPTQDSSTEAGGGRFDYYDGVGTTSIQNEAPNSGSPDYEYADFIPSPIELTAFDLSNPSRPLEFYPPNVENIYNYSVDFLVEVWIDDPETVSYNCSCDDEYPTKTLAQMREFLMIRLGFGAMVATPLPGMVVTLNSFLIDAQEQIYRQYKVFRLERFFTWEMETGVRFYDLDANEDVCTKKLDPRMLTWVGISQDDNFWRPLVCGIKPEFYYGDITSWPTHYEIRQCIEVWPAPSDSTWKLRIKGYFGLLPFSADGDVNTVDYEAIQLYALANAKAHYGQPDAANYMGQFQTYIRKVTAGSHHTRRYIPGGDQYVPPPLPVLTGWPGDP